MTGTAIPIERIDACRWRLPTSYKRGMRVPGIVYASDALMEGIRGDPALEQVANVAMLPGIVRASYAMPDIHWGYGFAIGGVAAFDPDEGIVAPGGIGFDISCGVRLMRTDLTGDEIAPLAHRLADELSRGVPSGVGSEGRVSLTRDEMESVLRDGARWSVGKGYGWPEDLDVIEEGGALAAADPAAVSDRARSRGKDQLGTLGSGNHVLEVQFVDEIYDKDVASRFGIGPVGQATVLLHCGSRGLGHQVCTDHVEVMARAMRAYGIEVPDRQLACVPVRSAEGARYLEAMAAAANFAWANRQCITHFVRTAFASTFGRDARSLGLQLVYDVSHNMAKLEEHVVDGQPRKLLVHRKGATRAFPPGHPDVPTRYRDVGQPVIVPGDMARYSFLAVGTDAAMEQTWGSTCHGAGRQESRHAAMRRLRGHDLVSELRARGITIRARSPRMLAEEAPDAYKDVAEVIDVCHRSGISRKVARLRPLIVVKG